MWIEFCVAFSLALRLRFQSNFLLRLYLLDEPVDSVTLNLNDKGDRPSESVKASAMSWIQQVVCRDWGVDADFCD